MSFINQFKSQSKTVLAAVAISYSVKIKNSGSPVSIYN